MSAEDHDSKGAAVIDRRYSPIFSQLLSQWATLLRPPRRAPEPSRAYSSAHAPGEAVCQMKRPIPNVSDRSGVAILAMK